MLHCKLHSNRPNQSFRCGVNKCPRVFANYSAFKSHVFRFHECHKVSLPSSDSETGFVCSIAFCRQQCASLRDFVGHLKYHLTQKTSVCCPFKNCGKQFHGVSSFKSHVSRLHRDWSTENVDSVYTGVTTARDTTGAAEAGLSDSNHESDCLLNNEDVNSDSAAISNDEDIQQPLLKKMALLLLNLEAKCHIPSSTIQYIFTQLRDINELNMSSVSFMVHNRMQGSGVPDDTVRDITNIVNTSPLTGMLRADGLLRSEHSRKAYYKEAFNFVKPVAKYLGGDGSRKKMYHYVPIKETLQAMFHDASIQNFIQDHDNTTTDSFELRDIRDGMMFKQNEFFKCNPSGLQILLYQDSFEAVNPLGAARGKHKLLGVYFTLGNLHPAVRSRIDTLQLVIICKERYLKEFGADVVFRPLIDDLNSLETVGIDIGNEIGVVKGALVSILGDNLGSHFIGGFVESFSGSGHFCRFCMTTNEELANGQHNAACSETRTPERYDNALQQLRAQERLSVEGVKAESVFNSLRSYHVCQPGLPPCIAHDLFEGVVPYDLCLYFMYLVTVKKWFTYQYLNHQIDSFPFRGAEAKDRPAVINVKTGRVVGHAVQTWNLVRFLPLLIGIKIEDTDDAVWQLILKLRRLVELVCAPVVTNGIIAEMKDVIDDYLEDRLQHFQQEKLKPKHHFVSHYPLLTVKFGPLIRLWTLRFESKHSYFKSCIRAANNFKNVSFTLANKHQLLQAMYSAGSLFRQPVEVLGGIPFDHRMYSARINESLEPHPHLMDSTLTQICECVTANGLYYSKSAFVGLSRNEEDEVQYGDIKLILVHNEFDVYLICQLHNSQVLYDVGLVEVSNTADAIYVCKSLEIYIHLRLTL